MNYINFLSVVGPMGSDHTIQVIEVKEKSLSFRGFTHNMLNKMHNRDDCPVEGKNIQK